MVWVNLEEEIAQEFEAAQAIVPQETDAQRLAATFRGSLGVREREFFVIRPSRDVPREQLVRRYKRRQVSAERKMEIALRSGLRPTVWNAAWRDMAARLGIEAPPNRPKQKEAGVQLRMRQLANGVRPKRWGADWREAAKRLDMPLPAGVKGAR
jgi:hypothetical protein